MAFIEWTSDLKVGVAVIDHEHHRLISDLNKLHIATVSRYTPQELAEMLHSFVIDFEECVDMENDLLGEVGYPKAAEHTFLHETLASQLLDIDWQVISEKKPIDLETLQHIAALLVDHIKGPDREFAEHVQ